MLFTINVMLFTGRNHEHTKLSNGTNIFSFIDHMYHDRGVALPLRTYLTNSV
jgi:hypothetical protein